MGSLKIQLISFVTSEITNLRIDLGTLIKDYLLKKLWCIKTSWYMYMPNDIGMYEIVKLSDFTPFNYIILSVHYYV